MASLVHLELIKQYEQRYKRRYINKRNVTATNEELGAMIKLGEYYEEQKDFKNMKKYYEMAIKNDPLGSASNIAMFNLGFYYDKIGHNEENALKTSIKYYSMAAKNGHVNAMFNLGLYCEKLKDYEYMIIYYEMAIEKGSTHAMVNLGNYYAKQKDLCHKKAEQESAEKNMIKYYEMAAEKGSDEVNVDIMYKLGNYYDDNNDFEKMIKYYLMAVEKDSIYAMINLGNYYKRQNDYVNMIKYFEMALLIYSASFEIGSLSDTKTSSERYKDVIETINDYLRDPYGGVYGCRENFGGNSEESDRDNDCKFSIDNFDKLLVCKKYLDASNLKRLNTYLKIYCFARSSKNPIDIKINDCCICFDKREQLLFHCGHSVCFICYDKIDTFCTKMCPLCRKDI